MAETRAYLNGISVENGGNPAIRGIRLEKSGPDQEKKKEMKTGCGWNETTRRCGGAPDPVEPSQGMFMVNVSSVRAKR